MSEVLYDTQEEFYREEVIYRKLNSTEARSFNIRQHLHEILTKAIFSYCPCNALLDLIKTNRPSPEDWENCFPKWVGLNAEPFPHVSKHIFVM